MDMIPPRPTDSQHNPPATLSVEKAHHPTIMRASSVGSWAVCACGWRSGTFASSTGAHLAFGKHLVEAKQ